MSGRAKALSGRNTMSSLPGGIFAKPPEYDGQQILAQKQAIEGQVHGRYNTSSIAGGIFAAGQGSPAAEGLFAAGGARLPHTAMGAGARPQSVAGRPYVNDSSVSGGIFERDEAPSVLYPGKRLFPLTSDPSVPTNFRPRDPGPILGGGGHRQAWTTPDAAGGRSSNAHQLQSVPMRGNLHGRQTQPSSADGAFARFLSEHSGNGSSASAPSSELFERAPYRAPTQPPSDRSRAQNDAFLEAVSAAEERDEEDLQTLAQLRELAEQEEIIEAAAAQLALEQQLGPAEQEALRVAMLERVRHKARTLQQQMMQNQMQQQQQQQQMTQGDHLMRAKMQRQQQRPSSAYSEYENAGGAGAAHGPPPAGSRPAGGPSGRPLHGLMHGAPPPASRGVVMGAPGMGSLHGILASPRGEVVQELPNPLKGRGAFNPAAGADGAMPTGFDTADAAGQAGGAAGWKAGGGGVAGGQHYAQLRLEHYHSPAKQPPIGKLKPYRPESQVSFGGPARILYPSSDVMIRGKFPGY